MALSQAIKQHEVKVNPKCAVGQLVDSLPKEDQKVLQEAIKNGVATHTLVLALRQEGYKSSDNNFNLHRHGNCKCPKIA
jgi:hypothetical protein